MNKPFHTRYGRLGAALLLLIIAFIVHSCKKNALTPAVDDLLTGNTVSAEIKVWLAAQKADSVTINDLLKQADWQTAHAA